MEGWSKINRCLKKLEFKRKRQKDIKEGKRWLNKVWKGEKKFKRSSLTLRNQELRQKGKDFRGFSFGGNKSI